MEKYYLYKQQQKSMTQKCEWNAKQQAMTKILPAWSNGEVFSFAGHKIDSIVISKAVLHRSIAWFSLTNKKWLFTKQ